MSSFGSVSCLQRLNRIWGKTLRILNHHFKDDFKALWGKKYKVVCDYTQRIRIYFGLVDAGDDIEMPLFIDGKSKKDNTLFKRVNQDNFDEAQSI